MKIIGSGEKVNGDDTYFIQLTNDELANLTGYYSHYDSDCPKFHAGLEFNISKMYQQLYGLSYHKKNIETMKKSLMDMADYLEEIDPIIENDLNDNSK